MDEALRILSETGRWRARNVKYWAGSWNRIREQLPTFTTEDFQTREDGPANPYLKAVVRQPLNVTEKAIPVGVVSFSYTLAQHLTVGEKCLEGLKSIGVETANIDCEVGLTQLGEWMNLRFYLPDPYNWTPPDKHPIRLRLECTNSVDGSSRLVILLSWLRLVCSNGLVVRESKTEIRDIHNDRLNLDKIPEVINESMTFIDKDVNRLMKWSNRRVQIESLVTWVNVPLSNRWGKKAACRVFHICESGHDVELTDPFASGTAIEKPVQKLGPVPGAPERVKNVYDVSQALSWIATNRTNTEERLIWQSQIPEIVDELIVTL